jgi:chromosomal replication initiator protein
MPPLTPQQTRVLPVSQIWERILSALSSEVSVQDHRTWFEPLRPVELNGSILILEAPNTFHRDWVEENHLATLRRAIDTLPGAPVTISLRVVEHPASPPPQAAPGGAPAVPAERTRGESTRAGFDPAYTFENFVVGSSNQFAHAAALAVSEQPGRAYNPLFIYGGTGLGKTHLMQAIGLQVLRNNPAGRVAYVSSETFINDMTTSLRLNRMPDFRERYRKMDALLVDDIQFIAGKTSTMEEFFHTFNTLFESRKQIVVSSDRYPREMPDLEERLRSRFESGLVADIQPPGLETKAAILEKKALRKDYELPKEISLFLAQNSISNIRVLEGHLNRVIAFASLRNTRTITMDLVREAMRDILEQKRKVITPENIQRVVVQHFDVKLADLKCKKKNRCFIVPRHLAMYLCRQLTPLSLPDIGRQFGGRDHTTVLHALAKIDHALRADPEFERLVQALMRKCEE